MVKMVESTNIFTSGIYGAGNLASLIFREHHFQQRLRIRIFPLKILRNDLNGICLPILYHIGI